MGTLGKFGVGEELKRIRDSRKIRIGHGKMRNSRYIMRKGPLIIYGDENNFFYKVIIISMKTEVCVKHLPLQGSIISMRYD